MPTRKKWVSACAPSGQRQAGLMWKPTSILPLARQRLWVTSLTGSEPAAIKIEAANLLSRKRSSPGFIRLLHLLLPMNLSASGSPQKSQDEINQVPAWGQALLSAYERIRARVLETPATLISDLIPG